MTHTSIHTYIHTFTLSKFIYFTIYTYIFRVFFDLFILFLELILLLTINPFFDISIEHTNIMLITYFNLAISSLQRNFCNSRFYWSCFQEEDKGYVRVRETKRDPRDRDKDDGWWLKDKLQKQHYFPKKNSLLCNVSCLYKRSVLVHFLHFLHLNV